MTTVNLPFNFRGEGQIKIPQIMKVTVWKKRGHTCKNKKPLCILMIVVYFYVLKLLYIHICRIVL